MAENQPTRITIRVQPNAKRNEVIRFEGSVLYLRITAPPVKGKANQALIAFLSDILGVNKSRLSIAKGTTKRTKVIAVEGLTQEETKARIEGLQT